MTGGTTSDRPEAVPAPATTGAEMPYFGRIAQQDPNRPAIIEDGRDTVTFGALRATVGQLSNAFAREGLQPGDRIVAMISNRREYFELRLAAEESGLYFVAASHHLTSRELQHVLTDSQPRLIFIEAALLPKVADALTGTAQVIALDAPPDDARSYAAFHAGLPTEAPRSELRGDFMGYTSGTTGAPKAVLKPLRRGAPGIPAPLVSFFGRLGMHPGPGVHLAVLPLYHAAPGRQATTALHFGHTLVVGEHLAAADQLALIERHRVTSVFTVPTIIGRWLRLPAEIRTGHDLSSLSSVTHGGSPCPVEIKRAAIEWLGPIVYEFYGATEGSTAAVTPQEWLARPGTVGRAIEGTTIRILDAEGHELPPGEVGTVYFRPQSAFEYLNNPAKTAGAHQGDLITVGDLGYLDAEGWLFLVSRRNDVVISGGVNVYPAEVEGILAGHPDVADVAVLGIADDDLGERVVALIVLDAGVAGDDATRARLDSHARAQLAGFKVPRGIRFVESLPRTTGGKLQRGGLRQLYTALGS